MHHAFKLNDAEHNVELSRGRDAYALHIDGTQLPIDLKTSPDGRTCLTLGERQIEVVIAMRGDEIFIHFDGETHALRYRHPLERLAAQSSGGANDLVRAPMPGSIVSVDVTAGESVSKGQILLLMESMKMETTLLAPRDGVVADVQFVKGQTFERDAILLKLEPLAGEGT